MKDSDDVLKELIEKEIRTEEFLTKLYVWVVLPLIVLGIVGLLFL
jgi:ABC-type uncharacterized transport system involved in gliding motility auxiliary subunit